MESEGSSSTNNSYNDSHYEFDDDKATDYVDLNNMIIESFADSVLEEHEVDSINE